MVLWLNQGTAQSAPFELSNAKVDLAVDAQGRLLRLGNPQTGHSYLASPGHVLWKMYYRTSDARELEIPAAAQKAEVRREGNTLVIAYPMLTGNVPLAGSSRPLNIAFTTLNVMARAGDGLSVSMVKYPFVKTGERWTSEPTVIRLFCGDWHVAARGYRAWADTWIPRPDPPQWLRRINGWIIPNLKAQNGSRYSGVYADLPRYWRDAHAVGIDLVSIYGWEKQGFDNWYPEYDPDPGMGGEAGLKGAIAEIQRGGGKATLYSQGQLIDPGTEYYRRIGYRQTAKDIWGGEYRETYGGTGSGTLLNIMRSKLFGVACPLAAGWYEQLASQFEMARKYAVNGLMYDQIGGRPPYICFDNEHPHAKPSLAAGPGKLQNMRRLRELIKSRDPDFAFLMELNVDIYSGFGDITQPVGYGFTPGPESFGEMFKYTFPDRIITNRTGGDRKACFGHGFSLQWRVDGMMRDTTDPVMAPYLSRLNQLRTQFADLLLEGRFVDDDGFSSDNTNVSAHAYLAGNRMAVTLWNSTATPQRPRIAAPGYTLESANWQDPAWTGTDHEIQPGDVAVLVFQKR